MMKKALVGIALALVLVGCATPMKDKHGRRLYSIACSGRLTTMDACYNRAQHLCTRGYVVVHKHEQKMAKPADDDLLSGVSNLLSMGPKRTLTVRCK